MIKQLMCGSACNKELDGSEYSVLYSLLYEPKKWPKW